MGVRILLASIMTTARVRVTRRWRGALRSVGRIEAIDGTGTLVSIGFERGRLEITSAPGGLLHLSWTPTPSPIRLSIPEHEPDRTLTTTHLVGDAVSVSNGATHLEVERTGAVRILDGTGSLVWRFDPPRRRGPRWRLEWTCRYGEHLCGLGSHAFGLDLVGASRRLFNRDPIGGSYGPGVDPTYCAIPVLVGIPEDDCPVLSVFERLADATISLRRRGRVEMSAVARTLSMHIGVASLPSQLSALALLTGPPSLPARWALGYHHARWGWHTQDDVAALADGFAQRSIPLSCIHLDIDHMDGYRVFHPDPSRYGDLRALSDRLMAIASRIVVIIDPGVKREVGLVEFDEGVAGDRFVRGPGNGFTNGFVWPGVVHYPDFLDAGCREWWAGRYAKLVESGVAGAWHDMNEPTSLLAWGTRTLPPSARHRTDSGVRRHDEVHNYFGLAMDEAGALGLRRAAPERRPYLLSRSGWLGVGRTSFVWSGDIETSFEGLALQVRSLVGLGLSGVPFSGSDIGGFSGDPTPELYVRWLELSIFSALCRTHSAIWTAERAPWRLDPPFDDAATSLIRLRYRLLPTLYTLAHEAVITGWPLLRPLAWPDHDGRSLGGDWDESCFVLGDLLVVAPVVERGADRVRAGVREGRWYQWIPGSGSVDDVVVTVKAGEDGVVVDAPIGRGGWLVRAGSMLALDDAWMGPATLQADHAPIELSFHFFPDEHAHASGVSIDDAGDGYGPSRRDEFVLESSGAGWVLSWRRVGNHPIGGPVRIVLWGIEATSARADGEVVPIAVVSAAMGVRASRLDGIAPFSRLELS